MVMQIGTVMFRGNSGASIEGLDRKTEAAIADKGLLSGLPGREWTGWDGDLTISGTVLPFHLGGLGDIEDLHGWCADGITVPVIRGDGRMLGWYAIKSVAEQHRTLARNGVGYEVQWTVSLARVAGPSDASFEALTGLVGALVETVAAAADDITSLFG